jgi:hypothetical protein
LSEKQLDEFRLAALIHDVGKSGPAEATPAQKLAIVKIFSFRGKTDMSKTVADMVQENFTVEGETESILSRIKSLGIENLSMRQFYDMHARWSFDILSNENSISEIAKNIAVLHHMDKKSEQIGEYTFGLNLGHRPADIIRQRVLMIIDQYQAQIYRSKVEHVEAIRRIKSDPSKDVRDIFSLKILNIMLEMGQERIFRDIIKV